MSIEMIMILLWFAGQLIIAAAVWGAIRADIKSIHARLADLHESDKAVHERMDNLLLGLHGSKRT